MISLLLLFKVEYHRALRRISVVDACLGHERDLSQRRTCRDARDRPLLLEAPFIGLRLESKALEKLFHCAVKMEIAGFKSGDAESGPTVLKDRVVDFSRVERFETWPSPRRHFVFSVRSRPRPLPCSPARHRSRLPVGFSQPSGGHVQQPPPGEGG